jgi:hypothetical protein
MRFNLFNRKKQTTPKVVDNPKPIETILPSPKKPVDNELEQYRKIVIEAKSEADFLNSQFENYIYASLVNDFETFRENLNKGLIESSEQSFWSVDDVELTRFYIKKKSDDSYRRWLSIHVLYSFDFDKSKVEISSISGYGDINSERMKNIVSMYYYTHRAYKLKQSNISIKRDLEKVIKVVGRDTVRDGRIDEILGN